jgi:hypothetical protein
LKTPRFLWLVLVPIVAAAAFFGAGALRGGDGVESYDYAVDAAAYGAAVPAAGLSKAGFSGFGGVAGLEGEATLTGHVRAVGADSISIETEDGQARTIRLTGAGPLRRIEPVALTSLQPGMTVVVRTEGEDAAAVLVLAAP